jgi:hypothetical protein
MNWWKICTSKRLDKPGRVWYTVYGPGVRIATAQVSPETGPFNSLKRLVQYIARVVRIGVLCYVRPVALPQ